MKNTKKIVVTGGSGKFFTVFRRINKNNNYLYPSKKELNILSTSSIKKYLNKYKPKIIIHAAALSRPMELHNNNIIESINKNIIGTANIVKVSSELKIKIIYFSTVLVYCGKVGNYKEGDTLLPVNNYAWSKLGGEACVQMYKNSLILRVGMSEKPFIHKQAFNDVIVNYLYHDEFARILPKLLRYKGIINIGSFKTETVYEFAKRSRANIRKISSKKLQKAYPSNAHVNTDKLKAILNSYKN